MSRSQNHNRRSGGGVIMKTYVNISNVPVEVAEEVKRIAESECDGNESAAYRKLIAEALEARAKKAKKGA